ncbi:MAG: GTPase RsgA, partial [Ruminococcus bromii]|nr:GTPase RsgA [Ruminococcus bromii]
MNLLNDYGYRETQDFAPYTAARVTAEHRERYELIGEQGAFYGRFKSAVYFGEQGAQPFPTVGDFVLVEFNPTGDSRIVQTLPRRSVFERPDPSYGRARPQAVAANFDFVFIVQSLNRDFNVKKLARYLTLTWQSGAQPVVVLTKLDLREPG